MPHLVEEKGSSLCLAHVEIYNLWKGVKSAFDLRQIMVAGGN